MLYSFFTILIAIFIFIFLLRIRNSAERSEQKENKQKVITNNSNNPPNNSQGFFNFENIGAKIKNFAKWYCWISIVIVWIACFICFIAGFTDDDLTPLILIAVAGAALLPFLTWIGCWMLYAFGELVESTMEMRDNTKKQLNEINKNISKIVNASHQDNTPKT